MAKILKMDAGIIRYIANLAGIEIVRADNGINKAVRVEDRERLKMICIRFKEQMGTMTIHHEKPIGVDTYFKEIFAGDTVRDVDGKEYTIDERGYAKSLDGVTVTGFKKLKDPVFVRGSEQAAVASKFQEKDGKPVQVQAVEVRPLQVPENVVKTLCSIDTGETWDWNLATAPDQALADELRRRGYKVTATKRTEL